MQNSENLCNIRVIGGLMTFEAIILSAAKSAQVSGILLLAICSHESNDFTMNYAAQDHGSPSYGICQIKKATAIQNGFNEKNENLMNPKTNAKYAALYLKYQQARYGENNWCVLAASYNSGSYSPSRKVPGCPRNLKYIKLVQKKLPLQFRDKLQCEDRELADENF